LLHLRKITNAFSYVKNITHIFVILQVLASCSSNFRKHI